jgi:hypothetical protein
MSPDIPKCHLQLMSSRDYVSANVVTTVVALPRKGKEANCSSASLPPVWPVRSPLFFPWHRSVETTDYETRPVLSAGRFTLSLGLRRRAHMLAATSIKKCTDCAGNVRLRLYSEFDLHSRRRGLGEIRIRRHSQTRLDCSAKDQLATLHRGEENNSMARLQPELLLK